MITVGIAGGKSMKQVKAVNEAQPTSNLIAVGRILFIEKLFKALAAGTSGARGEHAECSSGWAGR